MVRLTSLLVCVDSVLATISVAATSEKYIMMIGCDYFLCPDGFEPIMDSDSCIEAATATTARDGCDYPDGTHLPWDKVLCLEESANRPTGCYTYGACQGGCGLHLNSFAHGSNATCGDYYSTALICKRTEIQMETVAVDEVATELCPFSPQCKNSEDLCATCFKSPWYDADRKCTCGPAASDWMTEDQCTECSIDEPATPEKYIIMDGCDYFLCPVGFEPIMDSDSCIEAATATSAVGHDGCDYPGGTHLPWDKVLSLEESADRPTGCYTYGACQGGCGLYLNSFSHGSNATCGDCYSTALICKRTEIQMETVAVDEVATELCPFSSQCKNSEDLCATCFKSPWYDADRKCTCGPATSDWMTEDQCTKCSADAVAV